MTYTTWILIGLAVILALVWIVEVIRTLRDWRKR